MVDQYDSHDLINFKIIGSGGSASVYVANWKNTSTIYAIKKSVDNKEVYLTIRASSHENIIQFRGITKLEGSGRYNTQVWGVTPYVDPKMLDKKIPYKMSEKSDIYSIEVIFWELTSRSSPFDGLDGDYITFKVLSGVREEPVPNTNVKFIGLYQKCWEQEPDERPNILKVNDTPNRIDSENNVSTVPYFKEREERKKTEFEHSCQIQLI
ncbi:kinase-like protein [Rhizophagus irregularis]|uniref:Kinase-like protein n=1 Tax=Rhizophagus irregularis TaxID=588596 RepID=A0A2N0NU82_9GLOM|nr:kinase-like protein [Rhizophagus irregularis]